MTRRRLKEAQRNRLDWLAQAAFTAWRMFSKNQLQNHAAATAFYFLLSAAPLVLLLTYAAQVLAKLAESSVPAVYLLAALFDQFKLDQLAALGVIPKSALVSAGGVSLLTLALSSRGLLSALNGAFNVIFPDETKRNFAVNWALPLIIIPVVFAVVLLAIILQATLNWMVQADLLGTVLTRSLKILNTGFALASVWGLIYLAFRRLPRTPQPRTGSAVVSALTTLTLAGLFLGFNLFFKVEKYQAVYGALGGVVFILIGAYFACLAFYFWAQFLYALGKVDVAALERLFLSGEGRGASRLESIVFSRANRLLAKYGRNYSAGETLIVEGDAGREAIFIYAGRVGVYKHLTEGERKLVELEEGSLIGEMAHILGEARTASVRAETEVTALVLPPAMLEELMHYSAPLSRRIIASLADRLMRMNKAQQ